MKKIKEWFKTKQVQYILFAMAGLFLGWLFFSPSSTTPQVNDEHHSHDSIAAPPTVMICNKMKTAYGPAPCIPKSNRINRENARYAVWT